MVGINGSLIVDSVTVPVGSGGYPRRVPDEPPLCVLCGENPAGPGGMACPDCIERVKQVNRDEWGWEG